jgi:hypothetical protein
LAKPAVEPSAVALLTKGFKYELLTWFGIAGGALTLFTNLSAVLKLADWAHVLVENWTKWMHEFWVRVFGWLGIHLPPEWTPILSFLLFGSLLAIGQAFKFNSTFKNQTNDDHYRDSFCLNSWQRTLLCLVSTQAILHGDLLLFGLLIRYSYFPKDLSLAPVSFIVPAVTIILFSRHRLQAALSMFLFSIFFIIIAFHQLIGGIPIAVSLAMLFVLAVVLLSVAPAKAVSRRLIFLALGLLLLIALNELSKLGLDVTAPKLQG